MNWPKIQLRKLLSNKAKSLNPAYSPSEVFRLYSIPGFDRRQPEILEGREIGSAKQILYPSDVLLSKIVPHIRRCWVVDRSPDEHQQIGSGEWMVFRSELIDPHYLSKVLVGDEFHQAFMRTVAGVGGSLLRARPAAVAEIEIPLPPLDEQRRIAAVLDKADALRRHRQESLQLTEKLLQSVFIDRFGDPVTNPRGYRAKTLKEWGRVSTGTTPKSSKEGMFGGAIPFVTPGDLKETWVQTVRTVTAEGAENSRTVRKGATLVCCIGATIGKMGKAAQASAFNQQVNAIEWYDEVLDDYGLEAMRFLKRTIIQNGSAATLPILNKSAFQSLELPVAPIEEQKRFIEVVRLLERVKADSVESADEAEKMFSSLQQRAFRGELDLSRLKLDEESNAADVSPAMESVPAQSRYKRPGCFIAPPAIEAHLLALEGQLDTGRGDSIPWSEDYFKYRTLSQLLRPPFSFAEIWKAVEDDIQEASYETVKEKVFEYVAAGILDQQFDETRKEIVFLPRP